jgi:hypothetical protein
MDQNFVQPMFSQNCLKHLLCKNTQPPYYQMALLFHYILYHKEHGNHKSATEFSDIITKMI